MELASSCENTSAVVPWSSSSPPPAPKKKHPQTTQKCLPIKFSITSVPTWDRFHGQSPSVNPSASDLFKGFPPKPRKRTSAGSIRNECLKSSCHRTGRTTVTRPTQPGRVSAQWTRAIRQLAPVRGLTRPSIPPPFHWCEETCSQTFFPRDMFFFLLFFSLSLYEYIYSYSTKIDGKKKGLWGF